MKMEASLGLPAERIAVKNGLDMSAGIKGNVKGETDLPAYR